MIAELWGIEWLYPWNIPTLAAVIGLGFFGVPALLWVGARYIAKLSKVGYWRCVGALLLAEVTSLVVAIVVGAGFSNVILIVPIIESAAIVLTFIAVFASKLVVTWWIISAILRTSFGKAILAWLPTLAASVILIPLTISLLFSLSWNARELAKGAMCSANMNEIYKAIIIYQGTNNDVYPPSFQELVDTGMSKKMLRCPSDDSEREIDYFYMPPSSGTPDTALILCEYQANHHGKGRTVCYVNGIASWLTEEQFQAELAKPENADFAKALEAAEKDK